MNDLASFDPNWRPPILWTERLVLRPYVEADAVDLFPHASNPNSTKYTLWEHHKSIDDTLMFVRDYASGRYAEGVPEPLAICLKSDVNRKSIGSCGCFWASHPNRTLELGYWLAEPYWGRGIVAEAAAALVGYSFETLAPKRIQARVIGENEASKRVLIKLGFQFEGTLRSALLHRGVHKDLHYFAKLAGE